MDGQRLARLAQNACILEVCAAKPGNVSRQHNFNDTRFEDFVLSAAAIGPALAAAGESTPGQIIWRAARDTRQRVRSNTNLGIVLLLAPLIKACAVSPSLEAPPPSPEQHAGRLRKKLGQVLASLTVEDARQAYAAIRLAGPAGLGRVPQGDVTVEPDITLLEAMALAQERDTLAQEYCTNFAVTFETGYPALRSAWEESHQILPSIVQAYLTILAQVPDTLIARKRGTRTACEISHQAGAVLAAGGVLTARGRARAAGLDQALRDARHTLNPGTSADLTAAAIFLLLYLHSAEPSTAALASASPEELIALPVGKGEERLSSTV